MTTIACDGRSIAGDGRITGNSMIHDDACQKVFRLKTGEVVGFSGSPFYHTDAIAFLEGRSDQLDIGDEFEAIILHTDGQVECMDSKGRRYNQTVPCATGSGSAFALAILRAGGDARSAVEMACRCDIFSGGTIISLEPER